MIRLVLLALALGAGIGAAVVGGAWAWAARHARHHSGPTVAIPRAVQTTYRPLAIPRKPGGW